MFFLSIKGFAVTPSYCLTIISVVYMVFFIYLFFFTCYLAVPRPALGHSQGDSLTNLMFITAFVYIPPEGHREPRNEVGSLSPAERLVGFEPGTFRFLLQRLNPLGHSPLNYTCFVYFVYFIYFV